MLTEAEIAALADEDPAGPHLMFTRATEVQPRRPAWHWDRWLSVGALHLLVGRQGLGKSTFAAWVVGNVTTGRCFPGDATPRNAVRCALLSLEEPDERLVARLHAIGADLGNVILVDQVCDEDEEGRPFFRPWRLPNDCGHLEDLLVRQGIGLVVIDGLGYTVNGDSHNYGIVGAALSALAAVAERTGCAILGLTHPPKGSSDPSTIAIGSTAWTAVARIVWLLGIDPDDEDRRVVQVSKSNFKLPNAGLAFTIADDETYGCGFVTAIRSSTVSAEAIAAASVPPDERTEREEARAILRAILKDGPVETAQVRKLTQAAGVSDRTLERARRDLGVKATPARDGRKITGWVLELPDKSATASPPVSDPVGLGGLGALALNRGDINRPRINPAKDANPAGVTLLGDEDEVF